MPIVRVDDYDSVFIISGKFSQESNRAIGVASVAGWIKKEQYGDSNTLYKHDISSPHLDAQLKAVVETTVHENYPDLLASNLKVVQ